MPKDNTIFDVKDDVIVKKDTKKLVVVPIRETNMVGFQWEGGGELPDDLKCTSFTSRKLANAFLDKWNKDHNRS